MGVMVVGGARDLYNNEDVTRMCLDRDRNPSLSYKKQFQRVMSLKHAIYILVVVPIQLKKTCQIGSFPNSCILREKSPKINSRVFVLHQTGEGYPVTMGKICVLVRRWKSG